MKRIQIMIDEALLRRLDADEEVRRFGRSAVVRRATVAYLKRARARRIAEAYRKAYQGRPGSAMSPPAGRTRVCGPRADTW